MITLTRKNSEEQATGRGPVEPEGDTVADNHTDTCAIDGVTSAVDDDSPDDATCSLEKEGEEGDGSSGQEGKAMRKEADDQCKTAEAGSDEEEVEGSLTRSDEEETMSALNAL